MSITIPDEALQKAVRTYANLNLATREEAMRAACLAMIRAWPGMYEVDHRVTAKDEIVSFSVVLPVILPLHKENTNGEG